MRIKQQIKHMEDVRWSELQVPSANIVREN